MYTTFTNWLLDYAVQQASANPKAVHFYDPLYGSCIYANTITLKYVSPKLYSISKEQNHFNLVLERCI